MVVRKYHRACVVMKRALDDLARIHARLRQGAAKQFLNADHAVLGVEKKRNENFVRQRLQSQPDSRAPRTANSEHCLLRASPAEPVAPFPSRPAIAQISRGPC